MDPRKSRLQAILDCLPPADAEALLAFGEFLAARNPIADSGDDSGGDYRETPPAPLPKAEPEPIPRPDQETVMQALKRLSTTYPMLDRKKLLDSTSTLVMQHLVTGRERIEVIDELEVVFRREYEKL